MNSLKNIGNNARHARILMAAIGILFGIFVLIPPKDLSAATLKFNLSDSRCGQNTGAEATTYGGWSGYATDSNGYDADCAQVYLSGVSEYTDFRVGIQLSDRGSNNCNAEAGPARYTPWASQGGGDSGWATDSNAYDPNCVKVFIETRTAPDGVKIKNPRVQVTASDDSCGGQVGTPASTPSGGGYSGWAADTNGYDFDCLNLTLLATLEPVGNVKVITQAFKADGTTPAGFTPAVSWSMSTPAGAPSCSGSNSAGKTCTRMPYGSYTISPTTQQFESGGKTYERFSYFPQSQVLGTESAPVGECSAGETNPHRELSGDMCTSVNSCGISECSWSGPKPPVLKQMIFVPLKNWLTSKFQDLISHVIPTAYASMACTVDGVCSPEPIDNDPPPAPKQQCGDGRDNDGDGYRDYPSDPQCSGSEDNDELNAPEPLEIFFTIQYKEAGTPLNVSCSGAPNPAIVDQDTVTWTATASGGSGSYSYSWSSTDGLSGSSSVTTKKYTSTGTKTATVTVNSGGASKSANCTVTVDPQPTAGTIDGYHDGYSGNVSSSECYAFGWATYTSDRNTDVSYRVKDGTNIISSGTANLPRSDLASAGVCTNGTCAFSVNLGSLIPRGTNRTITVEARNPSSGAWQTLGWSPKTINCAVNTQPTTVDLVANPTTVPYNSTATLSWTSANATSCTASGGWTGTKSTSGSESTASLTTATTYRIDCTGPGGTASDTVTVNVGNPATVEVRSPDINTRWTLTGPNTASTKNQTTSSSGKIYTGMTPGSYSLTADSKAGYTLNITPSSPSSVIGGATLVFTIKYDSKPTVTLSASPNPVAYDTASTLTWSSTNATSCTASASPYTSTWTGGKAVSGTISTGNLTAPRTYSITCTGSGGSDTKSVTVGVLPRVNLTISPTNPPSGQSATLSWTSQAATSCVASGSWSGNKALSGSEATGPIVGAKTYTITCSNSYGSSSSTVNVNNTTAPTLTLTASTTTVPYNTAATLTWVSTGATTCTASGGWTGTRGTSGSESTGNLTTARTYTMVCTGAGGSSPTRSVTVNVASALGTVVVNSNRPTTWMLNGPSPKTESTSSSAQTYTSMSTGNYILVPATQTGYSYTITPASSQSLTAGSTITFNVVYTAVVTPTVTLTADRTNLSRGQSTMLRWSSTNATTCTASGDWSGVKGTSGSESTGNLTSDKTYTLTCSNGGVNSTPASVTVRVDGTGGVLSCVPVSQNATTDQTVNFSASGGSGTYSWTAQWGTPRNGGDSNTFSTVFSSPGSYFVTVQRGSATDNCSVEVAPATPDFSLSNTGNIRSPRFGRSTSTNLIVNPSGGFNRNVSFTVNSTDPALTGATYTFSPITLGPGGYASGSAFSVNLPNPIPDGNYTITVRGTSSGSPTIIRSTNVILTVSADGGGGVIPPFEEF